MASKGYIGALLDTSLKRLKANMQKIASVSRIDAVDVPERERDPALLVANQVKAFADWTDNVLAHFVAVSQFGLRAPVETPEGELKDAPDGSEAVTGVDVTPEGVVVAKTDEGDAVTSAGQDAPEGEEAKAVGEILTEEEAAGIPPAEFERTTKPASKGKSKSGK